jgi:hypothetical protein
MKIDRVAIEFTHADGQTDVIKPIEAFRNFAEALKKIQHHSHQISSLDLNIS